MDTINRSALIVKPTQVFLDWLHEVDPTSTDLTLEDLQREPTIYLVPECDSQDQAIEYLRESVGEIFEEHLDGWYRVPAVLKRYSSSWPHAARHWLTSFEPDKVLTSKRTLPLPSGLEACKSTAAGISSTAVQPARLSAPASRLNV